MALAAIGMGAAIASDAQAVREAPPPPPRVTFAGIAIGDPAGARNGSGRRTGIAAARRMAQKRRNQARHRRACRGKR